MSTVQLNINDISQLFTHGNIGNQVYNDKSDSLSVFVWFCSSPILSYHKADYSNAGVVDTGIIR